jgi:hypothetical protein
MKTSDEFLEELEDYIENVAMPDCEKAFSYYEGEKHLRAILYRIEQFQAEQKEASYANNE